MAEDSRPDDDPAADRSTDPEPSATVTSAPASGDETALQSTYAWSSGDASCGECGEVAAARWRDGEKLVCAACKSW